MGERNCVGAPSVSQTHPPDETEDGDDMCHLWFCSLQGVPQCSEDPICDSTLGESYDFSNEIVCEGDERPRKERTEVVDEPRTRLDGFCLNNQRARRKSLFKRGLIVGTERNVWWVEVDVGQ